MQVLPTAGFDCVETMARALAPEAGSGKVLKPLLKEAASGTNPWARRNAMRVMGQFCWTISNCKAVGGVGCVLDKACHALLKGKYNQTFYNVLEKRIKEENNDKPLDDAMWIAGAFFKPFPGLKHRYEEILISSHFPPLTRVRAAQSWNGLVSAQKKQSSGDLAFLQKALKITDIPAIPRLMSVSAQFIMASLTKKQKTVVDGALQRSVDKDKNLLDRVDVAQAIDRYQGNNKASMKLKRWIVTNYFSSTFKSYFKGNRIVIRSSFDNSTTQCWDAMVKREWRAFEELLGPEFQKAIPTNKTHADPKQSKTGCGPINILVFPDNKAYHSYMTAFVGFAANAGGLYVKKFNTLFTYQRTSQESFITVEELILHEFGHYLQSCYVLPGTFGTARYDKEPKGFVDEGLAEFWATLNFNNKGCYSLPLRENYMKRICRNDMYPKWHLRNLITDRKGYDEQGVFHYMQAYSLNYFLMTEHRPVAHKILHELKHNRYNDTLWEEMTGKHIDTWNSLWHISLDQYCSKTRPQHYPLKCPASKPDDGFHKCTVVGHGFSKKLWHTALQVKKPVHAGIYEENKLGDAEGDDDADEPDLGESDDASEEEADQVHASLDTLKTHVETASREDQTAATDDFDQDGEDGDDDDASFEAGDKQDKPYHGNPYGMEGPGSKATHGVDSVADVADTALFDLGPQGDEPEA